MSDFTKETLTRLYVDEKRSTIDIAKMCGCSKKTILRKMKAFGIERRSIGDALRGRTMPVDIREKISKTMGVIAHGPNHNGWKGGMIRTSQGYVSVWVGDHPGATAKGYVLEHRLVMEKMIGRYLRPEEIVHHINRITDDNRPENLLLCKDYTAHVAAHGGSTCDRLAPLTREEAKSEIARVYAIIGDPFSQDRFNAESCRHASAIGKRHGWNALLLELGIPLIYRKSQENFREGGIDIA